MNENIGVTVFCITYNHAKYIAQALDSFVNQRTNFPVEIVIHDDASTDGTTEIVKDYAKKYPNIIPIIEEENMYGKGIILRSLHAFHGKYLAMCEGDDYWCDLDKLQKQYDALEANPDCFLCTHRTLVVQADTQKKLGIFPQFKQKTKKLTTYEVLSQMGLYGTCYRTSAFFGLNKNFLEYYKTIPEFRKLADVGDGPLLMYFCQLGNTYFLNETMSCYRRGVDIGWTTKVAANKEKKLKHFEAWFNCIRSYDKYTNEKYSKECEQMILYWQFNKELFLGNYCELFSPAYRKILGNQKFKYKLKLFIKMLKQKLLKSKKD